MMTGMKHRILMALTALIALLGSPLAALAQRQSEEGPEIWDARLAGFPKNVILGGHSTALVWFVFIVLAFIALVVLFKNAKRTHLD
jgi:hypothetical protein